MKNVFVPLILALVALPAMAGQRIDKSLEAPANALVDIHNVRGDIELRGWDQDRVQIRGILDEETREFIFEAKGDTIVIKVELKDRKHLQGHDGSRLEISVPQNGRVRFDGVSTDLDIEGVHGGLDLKTISGDIDLRKATGKIMLQSVSGDLSLDDTEGKLYVNSVSGDLSGNTRSDDIRIETVSADIDLSASEVQVADIASVSGEVELGCALKAGAELRVTSVSGEVMLSLAGQPDARFELETGPGGDISNRLTRDEPKTNFMHASELAFSVGKGQGKVLVSTVSGSIRIE